MTEKDSDFSNDFVDSLKSIGHRISATQDSTAAMLYRLMFRREKNISVLDKYSDQLLDGLVGIGSIYLEEDYKNFLQYLKGLCQVSMNLIKSYSIDLLQKIQKTMMTRMINNDLN